jgi:signal transduction histidine kinase
MTDEENHTHVTNVQATLSNADIPIPSCDSRLHGEALRMGKPLLVEDALHDPRLKENGSDPQFRSAMITPLRIKNETIGALSVFSISAQKSFSEHNLQLLVTFANYAAISLRNAHLYKSSQEYAVNLEEIADELSAANVQLQHLTQVKDEFVSNVSHELRTPLTALKLYHDLLSVKPSETQNYLDTLKRETARLEKLIEDLLQLSRLDQTKELPKFSSVELGPLVADLVKDRVPLAESRDLKLSFVPQQDLPAVSGNEQLIGQTLSILLTNAMNYTPAGGEIQIRMDRSKKNGKVFAGFSVEDTGPGISPDDQGRLFERFFRGKVGRESAVSGTGLGLSIAYEIIQKHGGEINVENLKEEGKGAKFQIWLPALEEELNPSPEPAIAD